MGIYTNFIAARKTFAANDRFAEQLDHYSDLQGDPETPAAFAGGNEAQTAAVATGANDGTYTFTIRLRDLDPFTTAAIAHDANAAAIETAIDVAATAAAVPDWTNGDISVSGGPLDSAPVVLTFDGVSVDAVNHGLASVASSLITAAVNEVQSIAVATGANDGTYTLTIDLASDDAFTTAAIAHDANAATIETAIDVAATAAAVPDWTNGDISVSGGPLDSAPVVLTFNGASVAGANHAVSIVTSSLITAAVNEVQSIAVATGANDGTYTLTIDLASDEAFTTAAIAHDANAATIETAIDVAATAAAVPDWTNGDITVSGGPLDSAPVVLTFDGASVAGANHAVSVVTSSMVTDGPDEVQSIAVATGANDGTYTLTIDLASDEAFTTAAIAHDANAATIETAIDVAATAAAVPDWTNGDISVSGGPLDSAPVVLTFDGNSVKEANHAVSVVTSSLITAAVNEVQSIAVATGANDGTYTLTIDLASDDAFTTAAIAHDANAATIETAIDVAATAAAVPDWTNGDITVSGGPLDSAPVVLTFDGASVAGANHAVSVVTSSLITAAVNEVQSIAAAPSDDGTYTLTIDLASDDAFTTAAIAHDANAATIETAIDVAATAAAVPDWTNGDISVSGGPIDTNPVVLTFDGASVDGANHATTVCNSSLTLVAVPVGDPIVTTDPQGAAEVAISAPAVTTDPEGAAEVPISAPAVTTDVDGAADTAIEAPAVTTDPQGAAEVAIGAPAVTTDPQGAAEVAIGAPAVTETIVGGDTRSGWAILNALGVIADDAPPAQGAVLNVTAGPNYLNVPPWFVKAVALEIQFHDNAPGVYAGIVGPAGLGMNLDNAPET